MSNNKVIYNKKKYYYRFKALEKRTNLILQKSRVGSKAVADSFECCSSSALVLASRLDPAPAQDLTCKLPCLEYAVDSSAVESAPEHEDEVLSENVLLVQNELSNSDKFSETNSENESICNNKCNTRYSAKEMIHDWILKWNISHIVAKDLLIKLKLVESLQELKSLPSDPRTLLKTPRFTEIKLLADNEYYYHFGIQHSLPNMLQKFNKITIPGLLEISVNIDGVPISNSSSSCFYPILGLVRNSEFFANQVFIIGIYHGYKKPSDANRLLDDFVQEATDMINHGFEYGSSTIKLIIKNIVFDVPAKSQFLGVKGHSGYHSCTKCTDKGEMGDRGVFFPVNLKFKQRTDMDFRNQTAGRDYHIFESRLCELPQIDLVQDVVLDYMHLICLGVTKKLIVTLWLFGRPPHKLCSRDIQKLSKEMMKIRDCIPSDFVRKPRSFLEAKRFKATEYRQLLLYTGIVVFRDIIPKQKYENFLTLHVRIFCSKKYVNYYQYAQELLEHFVKCFSLIYGSEYISHNVHNLLHLGEEVKRFGPLDNFSAFPFENFLQKVKSMLRKSDKPLEQIVRRIIEQDTVMQVSNNYPIKRPRFVKEHNEGFILEGHFGNPQYKEYTYNNSSKITLNNPNNICKMKSGEIVCIKNFATHLKTNKVCAIGHKYLNQNDFFTQPLCSSVLNIFLIYNLSSHLEYWDVSNIEFKLMKLPYKDKFVAMPILHHEN